MNKQYRVSLPPSGGSYQYFYITISEGATIKLHDNYNDDDPAIEISGTGNVTIEFEDNEIELCPFNPPTFDDPPF